MTENPLSVWTVYEKPTDFPTMFVARRWEVIGPAAVATSEALFAYDLERLREQLPPGLVMLARHPEDDSTIVETWL